MAIQMNIQDAKTHLSKLVDRAERGEKVVIARNGTPVAELVGRSARRGKRTGLGAWKGQIEMSRFDEADEEIARELGAID